MSARPGGRTRARRRGRLAPRAETWLGAAAAAILVVAAVAGIVTRRSGNQPLHVGSGPLAGSSTSTALGPVTTTPTALGTGGPAAPAGSAAVTENAATASTAPSRPPTAAAVPAGGANGGRTGAPQAAGPAPAMAAGAASSSGASSYSVSALRPSAGPVSGRTRVTITGSGLAHTTGVRFGSAGAATFTVDSDTQVTAVSPAANGPGLVTVELQADDGRSSQPASNGAADFTYAPPPSVTGVSPHSGPSTGGTQVAIDGGALATATAVHFGATPAKFTVESDTRIVATAPAGHAGAVDVTVTTPGGSSAPGAADTYSYTP
jgi:hypothetical protein